jgi:hypothetical protein
MFAAPLHHVRSIGPGTDCDFFGYLRLRPDSVAAMNGDYCNCPKCGKPDCLVVAEEVDIGVGTQKHIFGFECDVCGPLGVCSFCGSPEGVPHASFCQEKVPV